MLVALAISHLLMPAALTLLPMPIACQEHLKGKNNSNCINLSLSVVETGVPGEKPLQAKLRADYYHR
jgi:hypothetical protein